MSRAQRIKATVSLESVVRGHGVTLLTVGGGRRLLGRCPFHEDQTPSFTVYLETQTFYCFGCHAAGDVITFERRITSCGFVEALNHLDPLDGVTRAPAIGSIVRAAPPARMPERMPERTLAQLPTWASTQTADQMSEPAPPVQDGSRDYHWDERWTTREALAAAPTQPRRRDSTRRPVFAWMDPDRLLPDHSEETSQDAAQDTSRMDLRMSLLSSVVALGMQGLARAPVALTYLGERGISLATARRLRIGYFEEEALLDYLAGEAELTYTALQVGLLTRNGHSPLARRLLLPELRAGWATQIIGRIVPEARSPLPQLKYFLVCASGEKGLLGYGAARAALAAQEPTSEPPHGVLVVEGALDYALAVGWRVPVVPIALLGSYPSMTQLTELLQTQRRAGGAPLLLLLDADAPGEQGGAALARLLRERGVAHLCLPALTTPPQGCAKDIGVLGPLGAAGREQLVAAIDSALERPALERPALERSTTERENAL
jgi:DNA primase